MKKRFCRILYMVRGVNFRKGSSKVARSLKKPVPTSPYPKKKIEHSYWGIKGSPDWLTAAEDDNKMILHDLSSIMLRELRYVLERINAKQAENKKWLASLQNRVRTRNSSQMAKRRASENFDSERIL